MSRIPRNETVDIALDIAKPILDLLEQGLELAPVPGLGLVPKALSMIVDQVKVSTSSSVCWYGTLAVRVLIGRSKREPEQIRNHARPSRLK